jgi:hypothetical protein
MPSGGLFLPNASFAQSEGRGAQRSEHCDLRVASTAAKAWALSVCRTQEVRISASPQQRSHRHVFQGFLVCFCLTSKMSEPAGWRDSCASTRRDRQSGSLHRFVRHLFCFWENYLPQSLGQERSWIRVRFHRADGVCLFMRRTRETP